MKILFIFDFKAKNLEDSEGRNWFWVVLREKSEFLGCLKGKNENFSGLLKKKSWIWGEIGEFLGEMRRKKRILEHLGGILR